MEYQYFCVLSVMIKNLKNVYEKHRLLLWKDLDRYFRSHNYEYFDRRFKSVTITSLDFGYSWMLLQKREAVCYFLSDIFPNGAPLDVKLREQIPINFFLLDRQNSCAEYFCKLNNILETKNCEMKDSDIGTVEQGDAPCKIVTLKLDAVFNDIDRFEVDVVRANDCTDRTYNATLNSSLLRKGRLQGGMKITKIALLGKELSHIIVIFNDVWPDGKDIMKFVEYNYKVGKGQVKNHCLVFEIEHAVNAWKGFFQGKHLLREKNYLLVQLCNFPVRIDLNYAVPHLMNYCKDQIVQARLIAEGNLVNLINNRPVLKEKTREVTLKFAEILMNTYQEIRNFDCRFFKTPLKNSRVDFINRFCVNLRELNFTDCNKSMIEFRKKVMKECVESKKIISKGRRQNFKAPVTNKKLKLSFILDDK